MGVASLPIGTDLGIVACGLRPYEEKQDKFKFGSNILYGWEVPVS